MARKSNSGSQSPSQAQPGKMQFVNYDLTREDKETLKKASPTWEELSAAIDSLLSQGYKISLSYDDYSDCLQAFLIGASKECVNVGFILTARASTSYKVVASLLYKHVTVYKGVWHDRVLEGKSDDDF